MVCAVFLDFAGYNIPWVRNMSLSYTQITGVEQETTGGFSYSKITITGNQHFVGHQVVVKAQNEIYIAASPDDSTVYAITPDVITFVDLYTGIRSCEIWSRRNSTASECHYFYLSF